MAGTILIACIAALLALTLWLLISSSRHQVTAIVHRHDCPRCGARSYHPLGSEHCGYCFACHDWTAEP